MADDDRTEKGPPREPPAISDRLSNLLIVLLALAIVAVIAFLSLAVLFPAQGEKFTEFYLLGPDGRASGYPLSFHLGDAKPVIVGIVNHEYRDVTYDLVVMLDDGQNKSRFYEERVIVASGRLWEKKIDLKPDRTGMNQKLEFLLYADGNYTSQYRDLRLFINVTRPL